jgi:hypothetical protein
MCKYILIYIIHILWYVFLYFISYLYTMSNLSVEICTNFKEAIIIINSSDLYSSICDAVNLIHLYNNYFTMDNVYIITNNIGSKNLIENKMKDYVGKLNGKIHVNNADNLINALSEVIKSVKNNFILSLSSHGYANGDRNYINWNGSTIMDQQFHDTISSTMNSNLQCLALIDTCQSGTMLNLNYQTKDLVSYMPENLSDSTLNIICIGAVGDNEYDQDDISDFGYGGGLSSSIIDFVAEGIGRTISEFFIYYKNRILTVGHHPILSVNVK